MKYAPFCQKQSDYIKRCLESGNWLNIAEGGKRAGKNVINIAAWCSILETHPDKLHLAAGVSVASAKLNIIDSNGFGVINWFDGRCRAGKYQERDALYISTAVGEKVILISGGGKEGDEKYIKGNTYGSAYVTEVNECAAVFVKEVFDRTLSSSRRWIGLDLNPKNPQHWFYEDILDYHQQQAANIPGYGFNYQHFTLFDNLSFTNDKIRKILITYPKNTVWYNRDIKGLRTAAEGVIYDMIRPDNFYEGERAPVDWSRWMNVYYGNDYGTTNPFACLKMVEQDGMYFIDDEFYYDSRKQNRQKEDTEYADDMMKFIGPTKYISYILDPSAASFKVALRNRGIRVKDADNDVLDGIRLVSSLLHTKKLKINKTKCPNLVKELSAYVWDEKATLRGVEQPVKDNDHCCDALRYLCKTIIRRV